MQSFFEWSAIELFQGVSGEEPNGRAGLQRIEVERWKHSAMLESVRRMRLPGRLRRVGASLCRICGIGGVGPTMGYILQYILENENLEGQLQ